MSDIINNVISPALSACWTWFNTLWTSMGGAAAFFLAIFTFGVVLRFLVMPILGGGLSFSRKEERPSGYSDPQRDYATWASMRGM